MHYYENEKNPVCAHEGIHTLKSMDKARTREQSLTIITKKKRLSATHAFIVQY